MYPLSNVPRSEQRRILFDILRSGSPFQSPAGEIFVKIAVGPDAHDSISIRSPQFRGWIVASFFRECSSAPDRHLIADVLRTGESIAFFSGCPQLPLGLRVLVAAQKIILDLASPRRDCIEITAAGWGPGDAFQVGFVHHGATQSLPTPAASEHALDKMRALLPVASNSDWARALIWLTASLQPAMPAPILVVEGPSGSGKSTTARFLRSLIDPHSSPFTQLPGSAAAVRRHGAESHILVYDQVGRIPDRIAAALCEAADEQHHPIILIRAAGSPVPLPETIARRSLTVTLQPPAGLRTLYDLKREFESIQPAVLAALCNAVSCALARRDAFATRTYQRLADVTAWALAAAPALELSEESVASAVLTGGADPPVGGRPPGRTPRPRPAHLTSRI